MTIADKLGVKFLLDGSVRRSGNSVASRRTSSTARRDSAAGPGPSTGRIRTSSRAERDRGDRRARADHPLCAGPRPADRRRRNPPRVAAGPTYCVAAFDAYLRGRALYDLSADEASERAALAQFDAAIAADPAYAAAHAARARSLTAIANQYGGVNGRRAPRCRNRLRHRAIEIAPDLCGCAFDAGIHALPGPAGCARGARALRALARTGLGEATVIARFAQYCARIGRKAAPRTPWVGRCRSTA